MINVDADEVAKFEALAHRWWDADGDFKALHDINAPRVDYIVRRCAAPMGGVRVLDAGCGGGLLTEPLADLGADVTGIDAGEAPLAVARLHAAERGVEGIDYVKATPESFLETGPGEFGLVTCLETLEHVPDVASTVEALAALTAPGGDVFLADVASTVEALAALTAAGGDVFLATINRTPKAFALAIVGAEYVLDILPKGTHTYEKLIRPAELSRACRDAGLTVEDIVGVAYNPFTRRCRFGADVGVNYMLHARKI